MKHFPVMRREALSFLPLGEGCTIVDCTFGFGGYAKEILQNSGAKVIGIDKDPEAVQRGKDLEKEFCNRFHMVHGSFSQIKSIVQSFNIEKIEGIVLDLGVSSAQLDQAERGFSFQKDGPLDMRMSCDGLTAAQVIETLSEAELADIFWQYGEEKKAKRIARAIALFRRNAAIDRTQVLAQIIRSVKGYGSKSDPATKVFMALRIYVNRELQELHQVLLDSKDVLKQGGRLVVVTFHSLEDRLVKHFFKTEHQPEQIQSRYRPVFTGEKKLIQWDVLTKKPLIPCQEELRANVRSRSAKLRAAEWMGENA